MKIYTVESSYFSILKKHSFVMFKPFCQVFPRPGSLIFQSNRDIYHANILGRIYCRYNIACEVWYPGCNRAWWKKDGRRCNMRISKLFTWICVLLSYIKRIICGRRKEKNGDNNITLPSRVSVQQSTQKSQVNFDGAKLKLWVCYVRIWIN